MLYQQFESNLNKLLGGVYDSTIAIAVSGGSDSIALLLLSSIFANKHHVKLVIMTVDHNIRAESKEEVLYVQDIAKRLHHECILLDWYHNNDLSNMQAKAREARYTLMTNACHNYDIHTLLTAHHQNDYIENFYIRRSKKSSIFGLQDSYVYFINNIRVLRPLFNFSKQALIDYLLTMNVKWYEDKSNIDVKYERNKIRKHLLSSNLSLNEVIIDRVNVSKDIDTLQYKFIAAIAEIVRIDQSGFAIVNLSKFSDLDNIIRIQVLNFVLTIISGNTKIPRIRSTSVILEYLKNDIFVRTLHGCYLKKENNNLLIFREFGKMNPYDKLCVKNALWDNRFKLECDAELSNAYITFLTMNDYLVIKQCINLSNIKHLNKSCTLRFLFTLPVIKILEKVIAIPHISYYADQDLYNKVNFIFYPQFVSRFTHFY